MIQAENSKCPLCQQQQSEFFQQSKHKTYLQCTHCQLVYLCFEQRLSIKDERAQYDLHQNHIDDVDYRKFLSRIFNPINNHIPAPVKVLDYGCGPGPALVVMFEESGYQVSQYDPYYFPDTTPLKQNYQIITLTEVIEHCHNPIDVLNQLKSLLMPTGIIGIMTKRLTQPEKFANWHYKNDPTHVCFFADTTFQWIAEELGMDLEFCGEDSLILKNVVL